MRFCLFAFILSHLTSENACCCGNILIITFCFFQTVQKPITLKELTWNVVAQLDAACSAGLCTCTALDERSAASTQLIHSTTFLHLTFWSSVDWKLQFTKLWRMVVGVELAFKAVLMVLVPRGCPSHSLPLLEHFWFLCVSSRLVRLWACCLGISAFGNKYCALRKLELIKTVGAFK